MVMDVGSRRLIDGVVKEDDILKDNVTSRLRKEIARCRKRLSLGKT
jgi:hypothetical protein